MKEIWKDIPEYEGLYQISNFGQVKSFRGSAKFGKPKELILKPSLINSGYYVVTLYKGKKDKRKYQVHRLVAEAFVANPKKLPCVNHKDENKTNNNAENLEWCTYQYNNNYGTARIRATDTSTNPVKQCTLDGVVIAVYRSAAIAASIMGCTAAVLRLWCREGMGGGYRWEYADEFI